MKLMNEIKNRNEHNLEIFLNVMSKKLENCFQFFRNFLATYFCVITVSMWGVNGARPEVAGALMLRNLKYVLVDAAR